HPEPLIPISLPLLLRYNGTFALSPDGTHLAYAYMTPAHRPDTSTVTVYDLMTGVKRIWSGSGLVWDVAWAGDRTLTIIWTRDGHLSDPRRLLLLDTTAPGSSPSASRELRPYNGGDPLPAAKNVIYAPRIVIAGKTVQHQLVRYSARTGLSEMIFKPWLLKGFNYTWCDPVWT